MSMFNKFYQVQNMASSPVEQYASADDSSNNGSIMPSTPTSHQSSPESCDSAAKGNGHWQNRRRRRGTPRNTEKRPYHSPTHISPPHDKPMTKSDMYFALDCEMVGVGPEGLDSAVARVTICNWSEKVILDTFVQVDTEVTDYRTFVSGIEAKDLVSDNAMPLEDVRKTVKDILSGKILIGHALENDMTALQITHPWHDIRDSANYPPFMKEGENAPVVLRPRKLKELVREKLGGDIQDLGKAHDPVEDARSALRLYKSVRMEWEKLVMKQVASARGQEGRESEPSGRDSPYNGFRPRSTTTGGVGQKNMNYNNPYSMYSRSHSAPPTMVAPNQGYGHHAYYPQQHFLY